MLEFRRLLRPSAVPALLGAYLLAGCGDSSGPSTPRVASVSVTPPSANVLISTTVQLSATPLSSTGTAVTGKTVTWSSLNNSIATVTNTGTVTGASPGTVQINASVDGVVGTATITVIPPPVATVTISPSAPRVGPGNSIQLTATTRDAAGNVLSGRTVTWSSQNQSVATIDSQTGLAQGVAVGTSLITATSESVPGTATLTVATTASIASIAPNPLTPGASATITGDGFSPTASGNTVTVGGFSAPVVSSTTTTVTFTVPNGLCLPTGNATVVVSVSGVGSAQKTVPFQTNAAPLNVAAGQQILISNPANFCLQLPTNAGMDSLLIGVQSVSEVPTDLTPVVVRGVIPSTAVPAPPVALARSVVSSAVLIAPAVSGSAARWTRHRQAELDLRVRERATIASIARQGALANAIDGAAALQAIPASAKLGDTLDVKVPRNASCANPIAIRAVVKMIGARSIWLEDVGNPGGGFSTAQYQSLSDIMDAAVFKTDSAYFGNPTDLDNNSRIAIVVTKEINKVTQILGFTSSTDQLPVASCAASNFGELYYAIAPDPNKVYPSPIDPAPYPADSAYLDAPVLIAHELTHVIQFSRRTQNNAPVFLSTWEAEGQATLAEEVAGHAATNRAIGQNYGFFTAFNSNATGTSRIDPHDWYIASFIDLVLYYGFTSRTTNLGNAPEECGWLGQQNRSNIGPCVGGRNIYGVSWSFLRWLSDQFGPTFQGGEQGLHRALINSSLSGFANIASAIGQPIDVLLSQWAASLYVDDRVASANSRLKFTSWNLFDIENFLVATAKLTPHARGFAAFTDNVNVRAGSTAYFRVGGSNHGPMAISVAGATTSLPSTMRVWVVRLQ